MLPLFLIILFFRRAGGASPTAHVQPSGAAVGFDTVQRGACDAGAKPCAASCVGLAAGAHDLCLLGSDHIVEAATCDADGFVQVTRPFADWTAYFGRDPVEGDVFRVANNVGGVANLFAFDANVWCGWEDTSNIYFSICVSQFLYGT